MLGLPTKSTWSQAWKCGHVMQRAKRRNSTSSSHVGIVEKVHWKSVYLQKQEDPSNLWQHVWSHHVTYSARTRQGNWCHISAAPCGTCIRWNSGGCVSSSVSCSARMRANKRPCEFQSYLLFQERVVELRLCMYTIYISCNSKHKLTESWWSVLKLIEEQHLLRCNGHLNVRSNHKVSTAQHCENLQTSDSKVIKKAYEGVQWCPYIGDQIIYFGSFQHKRFILGHLLWKTHENTIFSHSFFRSPDRWAVARASSGASRWWCRRPGVDPTPSWEFMGDLMGFNGNSMAKMGLYRSILISPPVLWSQICANPQLKHGFLGAFGLYNNPQLGFISGFTS